MSAITSVLVGLLTTLGEVCRARALALWVPCDGRLSLLADWQLDQKLYDLLHDLDPTGTDLSIGSRLVIGTDVHVLPVLGRDGTLVAVLQWIGVLPERSIRRLLLEDALRQFATILGTSPADAAEMAGLLTLVVGDAAQEPDGIHERTYQDLLKRCGWDVSLVATVLEMTRQTLYEQLDALHIARPSASAHRSRGES